MPLMTLNRDFVMATNSGLRIGFLKDKPTHVPPHHVADGIAIGAVLADGQPANVLPDEKEAPVIPQGSDRAKIIHAAFEKMMLSNNRDNFGASGAPNLKRLAAECGFDIAQPERDAEWRKYQESK